MSTEHEQELGLDFTDLLMNLVIRGRFIEAMNMLTQACAICEIHNVDSKAVATLSLSDFHMFLNLPPIPPQFVGQGFFWGKAVVERARNNS